LTFLAAILWLRAGRPPLLGPFFGLRVGRIPLDRRSVLEMASLGLVAAAVGYVYLRHAALILAVFPSNYDALTYHLSRVGYWLQYHSLYPWPTPDPRQTTFPINAELGMLWTVLWWGSDRLSGFVQWIAVPAIMIGIYGLTCLLGYSRWQAGVAALLWATLAQVLYQSSTTQNDLVTTSFWMATVYFFFSGLRDRRAAFYCLSGASLGLAIGTKGTSFMVLPGLAAAVVAVSLVFYRERGFRRYLSCWAMACLVGFLVLGSYTYVQNIVAFGEPFGPTTDRSGSGLVQTGNGMLTYAHQLRDNVGRYAYQFVDFSVLPFELASEVNPTKAMVFSRLFQWLRVDVQNPETIALPHFDLDFVNPLDENASWFGPLAILLIPAAIVQAQRAARERDAQRAGLLIIGLGFLLVQSALEAWTPYKGRYYLIPVALVFPLMACFLQTRTVSRAVFAGCLVLLGLTAMFTVTLRTSALKHTSWRDAFSEGRKLPAWPNEFQYLMVKTNVPEDASIGLTGGLNFRDYPFFGEHFTHYVTLAIPDDRSLWPRPDIERFETDFQRSDYLLLNQRGVSSVPQVALGSFELLGDDGRNTLWVRKGLRSPTDCDANKWPFRDFYRSSPDALVCPQFPIVPPQATADAGTIYISGDRYVPVISSGAQGFLKFNLLVKETTQVRLTFRVDPQGYTIPQTLQLLISQANSATQSYAAPFSGKGLVRLNIPLQQGTYTAQLGLADGALEVSVLSIQATTP